MQNEARLTVLGNTSVKDLCVQDDLAQRCPWRACGEDGARTDEQPGLSWHHPPRWRSHSSSGKSYHGDSCCQTQLDQLRCYLSPQVGGA